MSKKKAEATPETPEKETESVPVRPAAAVASARTPLILAIVAIALAVFATASSMFGGSSMGVYEKLNSLESRLANVESLIADDKRNQVRAELKKILLSVRELSRVSDEDTRAQIAEIEKILDRMTTDTSRPEISEPIFRKSVTIDKIIGEKAAPEPEAVAGQPATPETPEKEIESVPKEKVTADETGPAAAEKETPAPEATPASDKSAKPEAGQPAAETPPPAEKAADTAEKEASAQETAAPVPPPATEK
ncbi:MAG: hypothetical protein Q9M29_02545 [Mariprofundaceae bacterium]|nr:hypothetical protein [Mariprofundaceae bacterium]